jgi:NADPH-dependent 2,4-dienoyl-CoA reductase/sulfur reductase-like enzyme
MAAIVAALAALCLVAVGGAVNADTTHVVVVGGGFAGLGVATTLEVSL